MKSATDKVTQSRCCTHAVRIRRPAIALYSAWQALARRPSESVERCRATTAQREQNAVIKAPCVGSTHTALLVDQIPGVFLAWRSLPQAGVREIGEVWFYPTADANATEVRVVLRWESDALEEGNEPVVEHARAQIEQNLDCFKCLMEN